jgi:deazaflavin-dependent oxidoreductase (nitroreductase family)
MSHLSFIEIAALIEAAVTIVLRAIWMAPNWGEKLVSLAYAIREFRHSRETRHPTESIHHATGSSHAGAAPSASLRSIATNTPNTAGAHFERKRPGWFTARVFNPIVAALTRRGISVFGSRVLEVRGRTSGLPRRTPVNLLEFEGGRYLVAPRGDTQWARNLRAGGEGRLLVGRRSERFTAVELDDAHKPPLLRAYLKRWKFEVGAFFDGVGPSSSEEQLLAAAPKHPVFRLLQPPRPDGVADS